MTKTNEIRIAKWEVRNRDNNWQVEYYFHTELEARIFTEEWNSHPDVMREQMKVFGPGA